MPFSLFNKSGSQEVVELFRRVFSAAEGEAEGQIIADFVTQLLATTQPKDLIGCIAEENDILVGCLFFSRLWVSSGQVAFILSPLAVATEAQKKGVGQGLIQYGLDHLKSLEVNLVFTYGDPSYYAKTGFEPISENKVKAPCPLSQPIGWLAQSLDASPIQTMSGPTKCVEALNDPSLW
ncbi:N-acetyltransferase [Marinomonas sp. THO17]|uniref:GNAT family N-acetyltransferase n=1 Tax=Marinomonas sp. THO17 TaxID=3149048 RepID=UPI00336C2070